MIAPQHDLSWYFSLPYRQNANLHVGSARTGQSEWWHATSNVMLSPSLVESITGRRYRKSVETDSP